LYREMRLLFERIEAETPEAAAAIVRDRLTEDADDISDCDGDTFAALVDVAGDDQYEQSVMIDFEGERLRKAAPELLAALKDAHRLILDMGRIIRGLDDNHEWLEFWTQDGSYLCCDSRFDAIDAAIAKATSIENQPKRSDHHA